MIKLEVEARILREVTAYIEGKFEPGIFETIGSARGKDQARRRVKRWAMKAFKELTKGPGLGHTYNLDFGDYNDLT